MKKRLFLLIASLFLLSGCSNSKSNENNVNNPYEIAKGTYILSYYDTEDSIDMEGFKILKNEPSNVIGILNQSDNRIIVNNGTIRCIYIVDENIITYKGISVGDSVDKIENTFEHEYKLNDYYSVLFNNDKEEDPANQNQEDAWIWITYFTDGSKITSIQIYDVLYGSELK